MAERDHQGVFLQFVALGLKGERVLPAGLFGLLAGLGVELPRRDVDGLRQTQ